MTTQIHDSDHCTAGANGGKCEMCQFASKLPSESFQGYQRLSEGVKIDSSPFQTPGMTISAPADFEREWAQAPRWATRTTEHDSAEYWFLRGTIAEQLRQTQEDNRAFREMAERRGLL